MELDAFYGRVARIVVLLLVAAGAIAFVCLVLAPASFRALGGGVGALLLVKASGALLLGAVLSPLLPRSALPSGSRLVFFALLALITFTFILTGATRDLGLHWLDRTIALSWPLAMIAPVLLSKRFRAVKDTERKS